VNLEVFDFDVPKELIAQVPWEPRDGSRLLVIERAAKKNSHRHFYDLPDHLRSGDALVINRTKVRPARILTKNLKGKEIEILLIRPLQGETHRWECLFRSSRKTFIEVELPAGGGRAFLNCEGDGPFVIELPDLSPKEFLAWLDQNGTAPLPPYIRRKSGPNDLNRYQTVFAQELGSAAAPTAGLHFTPGLLQKCVDRGVKILEITLHVGLGTFGPIRTQTIEAHQMHEEFFSISPSVFEELEKTRAAGGRIIPVGTTSLRALESIPEWGLSGNTRIFIRPGHVFRWADGLITNFHVPKSSLFVLVSTFLGLETAHACYREAIQERYRLFSYGDAMVIF
jgi:S-adenosylmethionine:tRNA ribosyltransferase-isomerase